MTTHIFDKVHCRYCHHWIKVGQAHYRVTPTARCYWLCQPCSEKEGQG